MNHTLLFPKNAADTIHKLVEKEEQAYRDGIEKAASLVLESGARFVFLAGPSCSGKTTTSLCLVEKLKQRGKRVMTFSTDDFFFDQSTAPKNEDGTPNYDAFEHTDSVFLCSVLQKLSKGHDVALPIFDFVTGKRKSTFYPVSPNDYDIFILEGIHALNDQIVSNLPEKEKSICFYLNVTKKVAMEGKEEDALSPEEIRFCRRLIRDFKHREAQAERTFRLWRNVLSAEKVILHPFSKNALLTLETNFCYEIAVEKEEVLSLLLHVKETDTFFPEAKALAEKIRFFPTLSEEIVPENSVLREFID